MKLSRWGLVVLPPLLVLLLLTDRPYDPARRLASRQGLVEDPFVELRSDIEHRRRQRTEVAQWAANAAKPVAEQVATLLFKDLVVDAYRKEDLKMPGFVADGAVKLSDLRVTSGAGGGTLSADSIRLSGTFELAKFQDATKATELAVRGAFFDLQKTEGTNFTVSFDATTGKRLDGTLRADVLLAAKEMDTVWIYTAATQGARVYSVKDLVGGSAGMSIEHVADLVRYRCSPGSWGGPDGGTIQTKGSKLVVKAKPEVLKEIASYLRELRGQYGAAPKEEKLAARGYRLFIVDGAKKKKD